MNAYKKIQARAVRRLLVAVIRQAVEDYRDFERQGMIVKGRVLTSAELGGRFVNRRECQSLIKFFRAGGAMDHLITVGRLCVRGAAIRERLGMETATK